MYGLFLPRANKQHRRLEVEIELLQALAFEAIEVVPPVEEEPPKGKKGKGKHSQ